jgi:hypothetical protein
MKGSPSNRASAGAVVPHHLRHQQARRRFGAQAQVHKRHGEGGVVARIDQIAMEQQRGANAHRRAAYGGDHGFGVRGNGSQELEHRRLLRGRLALQEIANVIARAEHRDVALDDRDADSGVGLGLLQAFGHGGVHGGGEGILLVHAVDGEGQHAVCDVGQDVLHWGLS